MRIVTRWAGSDAQSMPTCSPARARRAAAGSRTIDWTRSHHAVYAQAVTKAEGPRLGVSHTPPDPSHDLRWQGNTIPRAQRSLFTHKITC